MGTGACSFMPLSRETFGQVGRAAFAFLADVAKVAADTSAVGKCFSVNNAMQDISTMLSRTVARQVCSVAVVQARFVGKDVLVGLSIASNSSRRLANLPQWPQRLRSCLGVAWRGLGSLGWLGAAYWFPRMA